MEEIEGRMKEREEERSQSLILLQICLSSHTMLNSIPHSVHTIHCIHNTLHVRV